MDSKIKVHGRAQSRTVLGIVEAYLVLNPKTTKAELDQAFPASLSSAAKESMFLDVRDKDSVKDYEKRYFERADETIFLADGTELAMIEAWNNADFNKVVEHAKQFGIEVAEFSKTKRPGERGSFWLEGLNEYDVVAAQEDLNTLRIGSGASIESKPVAETVETRANGGDSEDKAEDPFMLGAASLPKKDKPVEEVSSDDTNASCNCKWIPVILMLLLFGFFMMKACNDGKDFTCGEPVALNKQNAKARAAFLADSLYQDSIMRAEALRARMIADSIAAAAKDSMKDAIIEAKTSDEIAQAIADNLEKGLSSSFNNINFEVGSSKLNEDSHETLDGIVKYLEANPDKRMRIVGHSSADGPEDINIQLSKDRANSVADYLVSKGIDRNRLYTHGMGSSKPISDVPEKNRRVEIQVF